MKEWTGGTCDLTVALTDELDPTDVGVADEYAVGPTADRGVGPATDSGVGAITELVLLSISFAS